MHLFQQSSGQLARADGGAGPRADLLPCLGAPLQPDMRAVTCLAVSEQASPSASPTGETNTHRACVHVLHAESDYPKDVQLPSML